MNAPNLMYFTLAVVALLSEAMKGKKDIRAYPLGIATSFGFLLWAILTGAMAIIPLTLLRAMVYANNWRLWANAEKEQAEA